MKILFIANNQQNDFLSDAVFHGLLSSNKIEVTDYNPLWYMYNDIDKNMLVNRFHGRGFTYYASLPPNNVNRNDIENKIQNKYFDYVIYGNIHRNISLINLVFNFYDKKNIIGLDGQDETEIKLDYVNKLTYFKRELTNENHIKYPDIKPISFAYPIDKIINTDFIKENLLATVIPGFAQTFVFNNEEDYFNDYRKSLFAYTWKKSGWDCLRHYEILSNGCIPIFIDIEKCPDNICTTMPKNILIDYYKKSGLYDIFEMGGDFEYDDRNTIITNRDISLINEIELDEKFYELYEEYLKLLMNYTKKFLTTNYLAEYVLSVGK